MAKINNVYVNDAYSEEPLYCNGVPIPHWLAADLELKFVVAYTANLENLRIVRGEITWHPTK